MQACIYIHGTGCKKYAKIRKLLVENREWFKNIGEQFTNVHNTSFSCTECISAKFASMYVSLHQQNNT